MTGYESDPAYVLGQMLGALFILGLYGMMALGAVFAFLGWLKARTVHKALTALRSDLACSDVLHPTNPPSVRYGRP